MKKSAVKPVANSGSAAVDAFMAEIKHPLKAEIESARKCITAVSPKITEEIKWKAPGFRTSESFATVNLRSTDKLQFIFHLGAKVRPDVKEMKIADPDGLLKWLAKDRCLVTVGDIAKQGAALDAIVRQWIKHV
jgi:hypothetical protein